MPTVGTMTRGCPSQDASVPGPCQSPCSWSLPVSLALRNTRTLSGSVIGLPGCFCRLGGSTAHPNCLEKQGTASPHFLLLTGAQKALGFTVTAALILVTCRTTCPPPQLHLLRMKSQVTQQEPAVDELTERGSLPGVQIRPAPHGICF